MPILEDVMVLPDPFAATLDTVSASEEKAQEPRGMLKSQEMQVDEYSLNDYLASLDLGLADDGRGLLSHEESLRQLRAESAKVKAIRIDAEAKLRKLKK